MVPWSAWVLLVVILAAPVVALCFVAAKAWFWAGRALKRVSGRPHWTERGRVWIPSALYCALYAVCLAYGTLVEPYWVEVTHTSIPVAKPVLGYPRFRIVHLSDLHLESLGRRERAVVDAIRREKPDLILLTGDYVNVRSAQRDLVTFLEALRDLKVTHGVIGVGGNWDGKFPVAELFQAAEATYLRDDHRRLVRFGTDLLVVGQDYPAARPLDELLRGASEESFRIFLHHSPDAVTELTRARVDLFLCGHTHGGQVRLPLYGAVVTMTRGHKRFEQGLYWIRSPQTAHPDGTPMYVSRGIGTTGIGPPLRFLARPEVAVIDLVAP